MRKTAYSDYKPFSEKLATKLFALAVGYLLLNLAVIYWFTDKSDNANFELQLKEPPFSYSSVLGELIPGISNPVQFQINQGDMTKGLLIEQIYSVNWITFFIIVIVGCIFFRRQFKKIDSSEVHQFQKFARQENMYAASHRPEVGARILVFIALVMFADALFGFVDTFALKNVPSIGNPKFDYYKVTVELLVVLLCTVITLRYRIHVKFGNKNSYLSKEM